MVQPEGFEETGNENMICKLQKFIYGFKQASHQWYLKFDKVVTSFVLVENNIEHCIYLKTSGSRYIFMVLYVDDVSKIL